MNRVMTIIIFVVLAALTAQAQTRTEGAIGFESYLNVRMESTSNLSADTAYRWTRYTEGENYQRWFTNQNSGEPDCPLNGFDDSEKSCLNGIRVDLTRLSCLRYSADGSSLNGLLGLGANFMYGNFGGRQQAGYVEESAWEYWNNGVWYSDVWGEIFFSSDFELDLYASTVTAYAGLQWEGAPDPDGKRAAFLLKGGPGVMCMYGDLESKMTAYYHDMVFGDNSTDVLHYSDSGWRFVPVVELRAGVNYGDEKNHLSFTVAGILPLADGEWDTEDVAVRVPEQHEPIVALNLSLAHRF